jgi:hypothetical protein
MARPEVTGRKLDSAPPPFKPRAGRTRDGPPIPRAGKSIAEFCRSYGISRSTWNNWQKKGIGPAVTQPAGPRGRVLITEEAEAEWKRRYTTLAAVIEAAE